MSKTNQEVYNLSGTVVRIFPPESGTSNGRQWVRNKFILKTLEGKDLYITKFGAFSREIVGKDVKFDSTQYNETNYTVQGEIEDAGDLVDATPARVPVTAQPAIEAPATVAVRRRGRPSKTVEEAASAVDQKVPELTHPVQEVAQNEDVASLFNLAQEAVERNLKAADNLLIKLGRTTNSVAELVALADCIGRTYVALTIEAGKNGRMANFRR